MKRKSIEKKLLTASLAGILTLSLSAFVYAETTSQTNPGTSTTTQTQKAHKENKHDFKLDFSNFVKDGTITQEQADKITSYFNEKQAERKAEAEKIKNMTEEERKAYFAEKKTENKTEKKGFLSELVSSNIISQDQADKIKASFTSAAKESMKRNFTFDSTKLKEKLKTEVTNGTITQEQSDKILALVNEKIEEKKALFEKIKNMTADERKTYFEANKTNKKKSNILSDLVSSGIITQDQATTLSKDLFKGPQSHNKLNKASHNKTSTASKNNN